MKIVKRCMNIKLLNIVPTAEKDDHNVQCFEFGSGLVGKEAVLFN